MQIYRKLFCLAALLPGPLAGNGQSVAPRYAVHFGAHAGITGAAFRVELTRQADAVFLRFGRLDSIQHTALRQDPRLAAFVSALQAPKLPAAERTGTLQRLAALQEQYTVYRWDTCSPAGLGHTASSLALAVGAPRGPTGRGKPRAGRRGGPSGGH